MSPVAPGEPEAGAWRCGPHRLSLGRTLVMGIVNVTPDSFSDGGETPTASQALAAARRQRASGADLIDVGGESTRPGASPVAADEELARVLPVVRGLVADGTVVSVDTRHAEVASACIAAGAAIVNDVEGFRDPAMVRIAADGDVGVVVMHMRGEPATMQDGPLYDDVVTEVVRFLKERTGELLGAGVTRDRIAVDPGIGFGKTLEHNLSLLRRVRELEALGFPVLVGLSRKRFVGEITGRREPRSRAWGSVGGAVAMAQHGVAVVRVHDVAETVDALRVAEAIETGSVGG